jgi:hypothetical protein
LVIIPQLANTLSHVREDLGIGGSLQAASNVCHTALGGRKAVFISLHFLVDLGNEAAEVFAVPIKLIGVREAFR